MKIFKKNKLDAGDIFVIITLLVVVGFVSVNLFPKTKVVNIPSEDGQYCYEESQLFYSGKSLDYIPSDIFGAEDCEAVNPDFSKCFIAEICSNCVSNKVACVCQK